MPKLSRKYKNLAFQKNIRNPCFWCDIPLTRGKATVDHLIPVAYEGKTCTSNFALACVKCQMHRSKITDIHCKWKREIKKLAEEEKSNSVTVRKFLTFINTVVKTIPSRRKLLEEKLSGNILIVCLRELEEVVAIHKEINQLLKF